jgi:hypothetical protein
MWAAISSYFTGPSNERMDSTRIPQASWSCQDSSSHIQVHFHFSFIYFLLALFHSSNSCVLLRVVQRITCAQERNKITQDICCLFKTTNDSLPFNTSLPNPNMQESFN